MKILMILVIFLALWKNFNSIHKNLFIYLEFFYGNKTKFYVYRRL